MTASDWAAWVGAVTGIVALTIEAVRWLHEGPRLLVSAYGDMQMFPDSADGRLFIVVYVVNRGTTATTLTGFTVHEFDSWWSRRRMRSRKSLAILDNAAGSQLPRELQPGQQWIGALRQDDELRTAITSGRLYAGMYHAFEPLRGVMARVKIAEFAKVAKSPSPTQAHEES